MSHLGLPEMSREPSLSTLPHTLHSKRHVAEDDSVQVVKTGVDDVNLANSDGPNPGEGGIGMSFGEPEFVSSIADNEPIVTKKELWSYYCEHWCT